ncbi:30S ribosomal protein S5 alanine N-acetyltransferase [Phyllobacterium phragmitis]|uniref:30S ribosomal protein S5 alanine N-acetyltransferase n=1 Tax=Phyllobacterium phragmitis TaxID=2670329 RepID=A0A2S9IYX1_9HYPH|nr:GNAT family protein [Phyllobacterium phragmitis]PRD45725.1 30S ribosomal protein S5 alanine N-acetyltransferase [Phyllobacterium phragmitis]
MIALPFIRNNQGSLRGIRVCLREPSSGDYKAWANLRAESREFLSPWEPLWNEGDLERSSFRLRIRRYQEESQSGTGYPFFIFRNSDNRLVGGITLGNIRRGVAQSGQIGYWSGAPFAGQGYMTEAMGLIIPFAFDQLRLHRLEAACIPNNARSTRLLEKAGFQREGLLRSYLKINGMWQDHFLYSLLENDRRMINSKVAR